VRDMVRQSALVRDTQPIERTGAYGAGAGRPDKARLLGLSTADIIQGLVQATLAGASVTSIRKGEELVIGRARDARRTQRFWQIRRPAAGHAQRCEPLSQVVRAARLRRACAVALQQRWRR
jgi:multidrug efflux pump subunit AcrB